MTEVSKEEFTKNQEKYFDLAQIVRVVIKHGYNKFYLISVEDMDDFAMDIIDKSYEVVCPECNVTFSIRDNLA